MQTTISHMQEELRRSREQSRALEQEIARIKQQEQRQSRRPEARSGARPGQAAGSGGGGNGGGGGDEYEYERESMLNYKDPQRTLRQSAEEDCIELQKLAVEVEAARRQAEQDDLDLAQARKELAAQAETMKWLRETREREASRVVSELSLVSQRGDGYEATVAELKERIDATSHALAAERQGAAEQTEENNRLKLQLQRLQRAGLGLQKEVAWHKARAELSPEANVAEAAETLIVSGAGSSSPAQQKSSPSSVSGGRGTGSGSGGAGAGGNLERRRIGTVSRLGTDGRRGGRSGGKGLQEEWRALRRQRAVVVEGTEAVKMTLKDTEGRFQTLKGNYLETLVRHRKLQADTARYQRECVKQHIHLNALRAQHALNLQRAQQGLLQQQQQQQQQQLHPRPTVYGQRNPSATRGDAASATSLSTPTLFTPGGLTPSPLRRVSAGEAGGAGSNGSSDVVGGGERPPLSPGERALSRLSWSSSMSSSSSSSLLPPSSASTVAGRSTTTTTGSTATTTAGASAAVRRASRGGPAEKTALAAPARSSLQPSSFASPSSSPLRRDGASRRAQRRPHTTASSSPSSRPSRPQSALLSMLPAGLEPSPLVPVQWQNQHRHRQQYQQELEVRFQRQQDLAQQWQQAGEEYVEQPGSMAAAQQLRPMTTMAGDFAASRGGGNGTLNGGYYGPGLQTSPTPFAAVYGGSHGATARHLGGGRRSMGQA